MQSVNVLRDDSRAFSFADKFLDSAMAAVRFRHFHRFVGFDFAPPCLSAHFFGIHEVLKIDGFEFVPDAAGTSEIGDSGICADSRSGKYNNSVGGFD